MSDKPKTAPKRCKKCMGPRHPKKPCDLDVQETITDRTGTERDLWRRRGMRLPGVIA